MKGLSVIIPVKPPEPYLPRLLDQIYHFLVLAKIPHETLVQTEPGLTNAVIKGVQLAKFDMIVVMDSDGSHEPNEIPLMYKFTKHYNLVVGTKTHDETSYTRRFISSFYRWFAKTLLNLNIEDPMSGFVIGKKQFFLNLKPSSDYKFLLQLLMFEPTVFNHPITFKKRKAGKSKASFYTGLRTLYTIISLYWKKKRMFNQDKSLEKLKVW